MYQEFGKAKDWKRIILPAVVILGCFSVPVSTFIIYVSIQKMEFEHFAISIVVSFFSFLFPVMHLKNLYCFPPIEIDQNFMVVNQPFQNRKAYTLKNITWIHKFLKGVIFIHNGFPTLVNVGSSNKEDVLQIIELIKAANKQRNSDSGAIAPPPVR